MMRRPISDHNVDLRHLDGFHTYEAALHDEGRRLTYSFGADAEGAAIPALLNLLSESDIHYKDLESSASTLEDIFIDLVGNGA